MKLLKRLGLQMDDILDAAREAGHQLVREGRISEELVRTISRELIPGNQYIEAANSVFQAAIDSGEIPDL